MVERWDVEVILHDFATFVCDNSSLVGCSNPKNIPMGLPQNGGGPNSWRSHEATSSLAAEPPMCDGVCVCVGQTFVSFVEIRSFVAKTVVEYHESAMCVDNIYIITILVC